MRTVVWWINGFGEEMSSWVRAEFADDAGMRHYVVYSWRTRGFIIITQPDVIAMERQVVS